VLSAANADEPRYPASLTKMMTIYMLFEALRDRRVGLDELVPVSVHAASMSPSKLGLLPGTSITVEQALLGLVTKSANDAAAALGELIGGGDEERFAQMMTLRARALGMSHTTFRNASGLPDLDQVTTARDLALLARHLIQDYPVEYHYFSVPSFVFHGRTILNHDRMLQTYPGADGLKTGYIDASGCNLVTSAVRGDVRLVGVVLGASNGAERDTHMASLLDAGFDRMGVPISRGEPRIRMPALIAAASAATLPPAALRGPRPSARQHRASAAAYAVDHGVGSRNAVRPGAERREWVPVLAARAVSRPGMAATLHPLAHRQGSGRATAATGYLLHTHG
jgi:D-alanyl-D-alanine carboxypeptidase